MVNSSTRPMTPTERALLPERLRLRIVTPLSNLLAMGGCAVAFTAGAYAFFALSAAVVGYLFMSMSTRTLVFVLLSIVAAFALGALIAGAAIVRASTVQSKTLRERLARYELSTDALEVSWEGRYWCAVVYEDDYDDEDAEDFDPEDEEYEEGDRTLLVSPGGPGEDWIVVWCETDDAPKRLAPDGTAVLTQDGYAFLRVEHAVDPVEPEQIVIVGEEDSDLEEYIYDEGEEPLIEVVREEDVQPELREAILAHLAASLSPPDETP